MAQGPFDHPSYLARHTHILPISTAGANTVQGATAGLAFPYDVRIRNAVGVVQGTGTSADGGNAAILYIPGTSVQYPDATLVYNGNTAAANQSTIATNTTTTTIGSIGFGTSTVGSVMVSGDMNTKLPAGQVLLVKNGTDATGRYSLAIEYHLDPGATWTA